MERAMTHLGRLAIAVLLVAVGGCAGQNGAPADGPSGSSALRPTNASTTQPSMTPAPDPTAAPLSVGPGEPWIVYVWGIESGVGNRIIRPDGTGDHEMSPDVPLPPDGWQTFPDWSPDGLQLAFTADDASAGADRDAWTRDLWIAEVGRRDAVKVLDCVLPCQDYAWPAWSPDGREIAYTTWDLIDGMADGSRLMALDVATGATRELSRTTGPEYFATPRWSPDGHSLVVGLDRYSHTGTTSIQVGKSIAIVDLDDASPAPRRLTEWDLWAYQPDWHPFDGLIVFADRPATDFETGPSNLYTIRPDGSGMTPLTRYTEPGDRASQPTWTPDGSAIIFTRVTGSAPGDPTMAMIDADGTNVRPATGGEWRLGTHPRLRPTP